MSRFMFVMFAGGGNVPVQLGVARRLVTRGHAVHVLGDPSIERDAVALGCSFATFATALPQDFRDHDGDRVRDWSVGGNVLKQLARVSEHLLFGSAEHYARDVLAEVERHPVDALAIDCLLYGAFIGAERSQLPTAQLHHMPYSVPTPGVPPFGMGLHPARGVLGRIRDRVLRAALVRMFERAGRGRINAARAALGLAPIASVFDQVRRQDKVLVLTSRRFDFAARVALPSNVTYVGPQLDDPAWAEPWQSPWPDTAREPLVLVSLGSTFQDQGALTQRVIDALGGLPVRGLVTLGGVLDASELRVPHNVVVVRSAPHHMVMPQARVVISHGGHGTVIKALSYGKPVLSIPLGRDQAENAARVEAAGAGLRAKPSASVDVLRSRIGRLLDEPTFAAGAREMADAIAQDVAADRAVHELETLASKRARGAGRATPNLPLLSAALAVFALAFAIGCGHGGGRTDNRPDAAADAPAPTAGTINDIECGPLPPIDPGNTAEMQKHVLDPATFPDGLCNDGTPAKLYFRPYNGAANRNKWLVNLHGGGSCSGGKSCIARWCNCSNTTECPYAEVTTHFTRLTMTNAGPAQKAGEGVFLRGGTGAQTNPYGDYNQVEFSYCTSDSWQGRKHDVLLDAIHPKTGEPVSFTVNFLGASVLDADIKTLRQDGTPGLVYTLNGQSIAMPDLDEATEIIVTGDSAGGAGTIQNLDYLTDTLRATNVNCQSGSGCPLRVYGLIDAIVGPDWSKLDFGTFADPSVRSYDQFLTLLSAAPMSIDARNDASCRTYHGSDPRPCYDESHVIRHHITTPFFVRMALRDKLISDNYVSSGVRNPDMTPMTVASFALTLHAELADFEQMLASTAPTEEKVAMTVAPGVFAPGCIKHDTIHSNIDTYYTTITPPNGTPLRLFQVFEPWRTGGTPTNILTQSPTLADTNCP